MIKHSMTIHGHRTSISLEQPFWDSLALIAEERHISLAALVAEIDASRTEELMQHNTQATPRAMPRAPSMGGLSSALRIYILNWALSGRLKKTDLSR